MAQTDGDTADTSADLSGGAVPSLRELILAQSALETGIPVLLFTGSSLAPAAAADDPRDDGAAVGAALVADTAAALGIDVDRLELFSGDSYLLQATLGERLLRASAGDGAAPGDGEPA